MAGLVEGISKGLQEFESKETMTGAIFLCEKVLEVTERGIFEQVFPPIC